MNNKFFVSAFNAISVIGFSIIPASIVRYYIDKIYGWLYNTSIVDHIYTNCITMEWNISCNWIVDEGINLLLIIIISIGIFTLFRKYIENTSKIVVTIKVITLFLFIFYVIQDIRLLHTWIDTYVLNVPQYGPKIKFF